MATQNEEPVDGFPRPRVSAFISYSRKDVELADRLVSDLQASGRVNPYIDRHDIAPGEAWRNRLGQLIAACDAVVFVISPNSASSDICRWEVEQSHSLGKRLLPLVYRDPGDQPVPELLSARNWIFCRTEAEYGAALAHLFAAVLQDIDVVREQTRLSLLAHGWASKSHPASDLLRGDTLAAAERWQREAKVQGVLVGERLVKFISDSRTAFDADQLARKTLVSSAFVAQSDYLAVRSAELLAAGDPVSALCLAIESAPDGESSLQEIRDRPSTPRSLAALTAARRHFTTFAFLPPEARDVEALHAAPDGSAFCGVRGTALVLFAGSPPFELQAKREVPSTVRSVAFSGNGMRVAVLLADCSAQVFERHGLSLKLKTDPWVEASGIALNWSGTTLVLESADALRGWSVSDGHVFRVQATSRQASSLGALVAPFRYGATIKPDAGNGILSIGGADLRCLDWSPASDRWLAFDGAQLTLRTFGNEVLLDPLTLPPGWVPIQARFSADGSTVAVAARQSGQCQWLILATLDGHLISTIASGHPCEPGASGPIFALSDNGAVLVSVSGVVLSGWDTQSGKLLQEKRLRAPLNPWVDRPEFALRPSPRGRFVAVLLDPDEKTRTFQVLVLDFERTTHDATITESPFSCEGAYGCAWSTNEPPSFAAFGHSSKVVVIRESDRRLIRILEHAHSSIDDGVRWGVFGPAGMTLVTCSCDRTARLWDVALGVQLAIYIHPWGVRRAAFSQDGAFVITLDDAGTLRVFPVGGGDAIAEIALPGAREIAVSGNDVVVQTDRLLVLPQLLDPGQIVEVCCELLPRDLSAQERKQLDLPAGSPECMRRHRKWPALFGQSLAGVTSVGGAVDVVRTATVEPAKRAYGAMLVIYGGADIDQLVALGQFVWSHYAGAMVALCHQHNLGNNNEHFELSGDIFDALLEVAEEFRAPELPLAMIAAYRGPGASGSCFKRWHDASRQRARLGSG